MMKEDLFAFFDDHRSDHGAHNKFFERFTGVWRGLLEAGHFAQAENHWDGILSITDAWERDRQDRIHKGTLYYFLAVTCILKGDLEKGFFAMHRALEEDKRTTGSHRPDAPALRFVTLDYKDERQFFRQKLEEVARFLQLKIDQYSSETGAKLTLKTFRSKFLEPPDYLEVAFSFVYELFHIKKILSQSNGKLTYSTFGSLQLGRSISALCLIVECLLARSSKTSGNKLFNLIANLPAGSGVDLPKQEMQEINTAFRDKDKFGSTLQTFLENNWKKLAGAPLNAAEQSLGITYGLRNFSAHRIEEHPIIYQRFEELVQHVLNALFFTIEKLY